VIKALTNTVIKALHHYGDHFTHTYNPISTVVSSAFYANIIISLDTTGQPYALQPYENQNHNLTGKGRHSTAKSKL
jgi:hypothetical protein